jgi:hypothetical protein
MLQNNQHVHLLRVEKGGITGVMAATQLLPWARLLPGLTETGAARSWEVWMTKAHYVRAKTFYKPRYRNYCTCHFSKPMNICN